MNHEFSNRISAAAAAVIVIMGGGVSPGHAEEELPSTVKIATQYVTANGCHDNSQTFTTTVPHADHLDRSYHGVLDGIEVRVTAANNGHSYSNFTWKDENTISYTLYAKGAGYWVNPPKVFGVTIGGGYCHGAAGGSMGIDVVAHYK
jgi:hypothetical protein